MLVKRTSYAAQMLASSAGWPSSVSSGFGGGALRA
jgi:hypothetical protein